MALCQVDKEYFYALLEYKKILEQKNSYLKNDKFQIDNNLIDVWNQKICNSAFIILQKRERFIKGLCDISKENHLEISSGKERLELCYKTNIKNEALTKDKIYKHLTNNIQKEVNSKVSIIGPHRDDLDFFINEKAAKDFASQGQQRSAVLSVKLAECELFKNLSGHYPMLLLDDIMSELDKHRQNYIINKIENIQVLITCCNRENIEGFKNGKTFFLKEGKLSLE